MLYSKLKYLLYLIILVFIANSCVDEDLFDYNTFEVRDSAFNFKEVVWSPAFTAPIGKTSVSLNRLFEQYNERIQIISTITDSLNYIRDTLQLSEGSDTTLVIYNDSLYMSELPSVPIDTTIQFEFGLEAAGVEQETQSIKYIKFIFNITNHYPTEIESRAYLLDENRTKIYTLFGQNPLHIEGGTVDNEGRVIEPKVNPSQSVTIPEDIIERLLDTRYLQLETEIWLKDVSPERLDEVMKFFPEYKVDIQIAVDFQVEVQVGEYMDSIK